MGKTTGISWSDVTWNWARGCTKKNEDCKFCYMMRDGGKWGYDGKKVIKTKTVFNLPDKIESGKKVFTCSLTDIFHEDIDSFREEAYAVMRRNPDKIYQFLTKRIERSKQCLPTDWGDGWENVWLGLSAGSQRRYDEMMPYLHEVKAKTKWVSLEPLTQPIGDMGLMGRYKGVLQWVVVGGESGNGKVPNDKNVEYGYRECELEWLESIVAQCKEAGVACFVKQTGTHLAKKLGLRDRSGADISELPNGLRIQNFPLFTKI
jgi:protein gp37